MRIPYGARSYRRDQLPQFRLVNMFVEQSPTDETGVVLLSRKGLSELATRGNGPIRGVFQQANIFSGAVFCVSGNELFKDATSLGTIDGSGPVSFAARNGELMVTAGGSLYSYTTADGLDAVTFPDSSNVTAIDFHDGLFLAAKADDHKYYWSDVLDGRTWDALDFASAESKPDNLLDLKVLNDTLWLFGEETIEPWANIGDADAPYQRFEQRIYSKGVKATGCVIEMDQALWFVGNDNIVYELRENPSRVSDHAIEAKIAASDSVSLYGYIDEGHAILCLRLDDESYGYDIATKEWHELASTGRTNFRVLSATAPGDSPIFGDDTDGTLYTLDGSDDDGGEIEKLFTAAFPLEDEPVSVDNLRIHLNAGKTVLLSGQGSDPVMEMRFSRDAGNTWSNWRSADMGAEGEYRTRVKYRRLGMFDAPGAMFQFRVSDPVALRVSGVFVNEPGGGRARG